MFDTEKFILEVEIRPALYDTKLKEYSNKQVKASCWIEVGKAMYENWDEMSSDDQDKAGKDLMKRWKTLRDSFVREFRSMKKTETGVQATKKKKYVFFDQLSFLLPHVKGNDNTSSNIPPTSNQPHDDDVEQEQAVDEPEVVDNRNDTIDVNPSAAERKKRQDRVVGKATLAKTLSSASKNITSLMKESIALQKADNHSDKSNDKSGNKAFMMSFVPLLDSLPPYEAFEVRLKITEVFRDAALTQHISANANLQEFSRSPTLLSNMQFSDNMQMRNRSSSSSTPCSSARNTPTPTPPSMNRGEHSRDTNESMNDDISENSNTELFNISDYVKFGIMPGEEFGKR